MKITIEIEKFDNGITLKWKDAESKQDQQAIVALDSEKERVIGKTIWDDVRNAMDCALTNKVKIEVTYLVYYGEDKK